MQDDLLYPLVKSEWRFDPWPNYKCQKSAKIFNFFDQIFLSLLIYFAEIQSKVKFDWIPVKYINSIGQFLPMGPGTLRPRYSHLS